MTMTLGMMIGPLIMLTAASYAPEMPLLPLGMGIALLALAFVLIMVLTPNAAKALELRAESVDPGHRRALMSLLSGVKSMEPMWKPWNRSRLALVLSCFIAEMCIVGQGTLFVPYTYRRFGWTSEEDGLFQSVAFFAKMLVMIAFLPFAHKGKDRWQSQSQSQHQSQLRSGDPELDESENAALGVATRSRRAIDFDTVAWTARYPMEAWLVQIGLLSFLITYALFSVATVGWLYAFVPSIHHEHVSWVPYPAGTVEAMGILSMPAMRSLLTQTVPASLVGTVLATISVMRSLAFILAPILFTAVYATTVGVAIPKFPSQGNSCCRVACTWPAHQHILDNICHSEQRKEPGHITSAMARNDTQIKVGSYAVSSSSSTEPGSSAAISSSTVVQADGPHKREFLSASAMSATSATAISADAPHAAISSKPSTIYEEDTRPLLYDDANIPALPPTGDIAVASRTVLIDNSRLVNMSMSIVFTIAVAFSMIMAPQQQFVLRIVCREAAESLGSDGGWEPVVPKVGTLALGAAKHGSSIDPICQRPDVQRVIVATTTMLSLVLAIPAMFATSLYGQLSDNPRIALFAMMTDLIPTPNRTFFFVIIEMTMMIGMMCGPLIMSTAVSYAPESPLLPIGMGIALMALAFALILIMVPGASKAQELRAESVDPSHHRSPMLLWSAVKSMELMWKPWNWSRLALIIAFFLADMCSAGQGTMLVPYTYRRFGWTSKEDGLFQSVAFFVKVLVMIAFLPFAHKGKDRWRSPSQQQQEEPRSNDPESGESETTPLLASSRDRAAPSTSAWWYPRPWKSWTARYPMEAWLAQIGLLSYTITYVLFGVATVGWLYVAASSVDAIGILSMPAMRSLLTQTVPASLVGTVLATVSVTRSLAFILAPILFNAVYAATVGFADGAVYYMAAGLWTIALALALAVQRKDLVPRGPDAQLDSASVAAEMEAENMIAEVAPNAPH
ncbi:hypothetical protein GGF32_003328 [Allomyces javanicus]|nr:hypothetical protein GGF32_003328 [Allomyces javanicus]